MIKCGKCKERHETAAQVKACFAGQSTVAVLDKPQIEMPEITDKQAKFVLDLAARRDVTKLVFGETTLKEVARNEALKRAGFGPEHKIARLSASHLIDELLSCPKLPDEKTSDASWKTAVPKGRYAVDIDGKLRFFFVRRTKTGFLKIREQAGPATYEKKYVEYKKIINAILAAGIKHAGRRYGQEIGECWMCGLALTDPVSRALGEGPICGGR